MGTLHSEGVKVFCVMTNDIYTCSVHLCRPANPGLEKSRDFCERDDLFFCFSLMFSRK